MPVSQEVPALIFKLDSDCLPTVSFDSPFAVTVRKTCLHSLNQESQFQAYQAKQVNNSLFVDRCMLKPSEIQQFSIENTIGVYGMNRVLHLRRRILLALFRMTVVLMALPQERQKNAMQ